MRRIYEFPCLFNGAHKAFTNTLNLTRTTFAYIHPQITMHFTLKYVK